MPTVTPESTFRQPIRRFTVSRPPRSACRFTCVSALYWLCVSSFPVGFSEDRALRSGLASEALRVVLRGFVVLPLLTQGQLYAVYLFFTTGGGGSVSLITLAGPGDRHFVACPHGLKLHSTAHDPTVQALVPFLDAILGSSRVTAERGGLGGQRAVDQWMQGAGAAVDHAPDIILRDFDKAGTYLLIDIKTLDAAGPSHIAANHTDRARLAAHLAIATHSRRHQYGILPPNMRLVILAVSTCGAINPEGHTFISSLAQRMDNSIPPVLLHQASWATRSSCRAPGCKLAACHSSRSTAGLAVFSAACLASAKVSNAATICSAGAQG